MVIECRRTGLQHLHTGDFRPPIYSLLVYFRFHIPYPVYPVAEDKILPHSTHQGHRRVRMHIDKTRNRSLSAAVDHLDSGNHITSRHRFPRPDNAADYASVYEDIRNLSVKDYIFQ